MLHRLPLPEELFAFYGMDALGVELLLVGIQQQTQPLAESVQLWFIAPLGTVPAATVLTPASALQVGGLPQAALKVLH
jgi:hypothetical protein